MVERGDGLRFLLEAATKAVTRGLDCNLTAKARIAGTEDLAHSAGAKNAGDFIRANARAWSEGHWTAQLYRAEGRPIASDDGIVVRDIGNPKRQEVYRRYNRVILWV